MKKIIFIRHCKADGQAIDAELTEEGKIQAEQLATFLQQYKIDYIVSSPFTRAVHSITPLEAERKLEIKIDERLAERVLSEKDHLDWLHMLKQTYDDMNLCFEGGESSKQATNRALEVISELLESPYKAIVVVTHGNLLSLILKQYDSSFGFKEWQMLSNPDAFLLDCEKDGTSIERIWQR